MAVAVAFVLINRIITRGDRQSVVECRPETFHPSHRIRMASGVKSSSSSAPKKLLDLSTADRRAFLGSFDQVMVDCDGCIWSLLAPIAGAGEGLLALQQRMHKRIIYVSNNSVRSVQNFRDQLQKVGLQLDETCLVNSVIAIVHYLRKRAFQGLIYVIGSVEMRRRLSHEGFEVIFGVTKLIEFHFESFLWGKH